MNWPRLPPCIIVVVILSQSVSHARFHAERHRLRSVCSDILGGRGRTIEERVYRQGSVPPQLDAWDAAPLRGAVSVVSLLPRNLREYQAIFGDATVKDARAGAIAAELDAIRTAASQGHLRPVATEAALKRFLETSASTYIVVLATNHDGHLVLPSGETFFIPDFVELAAHRGKVPVILSCIFTKSGRPDAWKMVRAAIGLDGNISVTAALALSRTTVAEVTKQSQLSPRDLRVTLESHAQSARVARYAENASCHGLESPAAALLIFLSDGLWDGDDFIAGRVVEVTSTSMWLDTDKGRLPFSIDNPSLVLGIAETSRVSVRFRRAADALVLLSLTR
jgi:hypothetical protein